MKHAEVGDAPWPVFDEDEIAAVVAVLRSGKVNQWTGDRVAGFERAMASRFAMPHAVAVANGSLALELALRALGIGPGDEVIVTSSSFVASASCVSIVGATPVFADVERDSQNISAETIAPLITDKTRAVIPVHLAGRPADMRPIIKLARRHGLKVIEDCAQAHGATIGGKPVGSFGDAAAFSFCQDKVITTGGEGGMALFRDRDAWERAWSYKDHGKIWKKMRDHDHFSGFHYVHDGFGSNWRLTEIQAAIGLVQLKKLDGWLKKRRANAAIWADALRQSPAIRVPPVPRDIAPAYYRLLVFVEPSRLRRGASRDAILEALRREGVDAGSGFCPEIYREKAFAGMKVERRPVAKELGETSVVFKVHPTLDPNGLAETAARARDIVAGFEA